MEAAALERIISQRHTHTLWIILAVLAGSALYLGSAILSGGLGFPLDDAWIHQTLSRNLVSYGSLSVNPGEPTSATTSPLWSLMLSIGYWLKLNPLAWAYLLGALSLGLTAWLTYRLTHRLFPGRESLPLLTGILCATEWRLTWASLSGMETLLFSALTMALILAALSSRRDTPLLLGVLGGLSALARPEGSVLLLWAVVWRVATASMASRGAKLPGDSYVYGREGSVLRAALDPLLTLAVSGVLLAPYLAYNLSATGDIMPSTFYAKNAFYSKGPGLYSLAQYLSGVAAALAPGPLLALTPSAIAFLVLRFKSKPRSGGDGRSLSWPLTLPLGWVALLAAMYYLWLPAPGIHHGRYLMPSIPILLLMGAAATSHFLDRLAAERWRRLVVEYIAVFSMAWWLVGAVIFGCNVAFINDQQVASALWIRDNTPTDTLVATHDVGAMGYFSNRRVLDTVGLITPELTRRPGEAAAAISLMRERGAGYLAAFPGWHPWALSDPRFRQVLALSHSCVIPSSLEEMIIFQATWEQ